MIDQSTFIQYLARYKAQFTDRIWPAEQYKWEAVQHFQKHWNADAPDFADMLDQAFAKTNNLLASQMYFPWGMLKRFANVDPELTRQMFIQLFDESVDLLERIEEFKFESETLLSRVQGEKHDQNEKSITTYLWLRYPDKYYIYQYTHARNVASRLNSDIGFKQGRYADNIHNYLTLYNEVCAQLQADSVITEMLQAQLGPNHYPDPQLRTMTQDFCYFISTSAGLEEETPFYTVPAPDIATVSEPEVTPTPKIPPYTKDDFLAEVFMSEEQYDRLTAVLRNKKNVILQGAPGVGKTFAAKRLAWSMMGLKDDARVNLVQFHQNYSYEDFIAGYKPSETGFQLRYGVFYHFCEQAANRPDEDFYFIIDEINRGNLSKIFGELLMLIEAGYRGSEITLAYDKKPFQVPPNVYILGMMNTADRSLAMIDYALRRRFSFVEMHPGFDSAGFGAYLDRLGSQRLRDLVATVTELNDEIAIDPSLGRGFRIGHSYFCGAGEVTDDWLHAVVEYDIVPMLEEYWFDEESKALRWRNALREVVRA